MLSVVIPSRTDAYLQKTVDDLAAKASGEIEIIVILDGYMPTRFTGNARTQIVKTKYRGMRAAINTGMRFARGDYVMKLDEHCMVAPGFDAALIADCEPDWVVVPRRFRLDADAWKVIEDGRPPVDYMYNAVKDGSLRGRIWNSRGAQRQNIPIDETMTFQGSCYFMHHSYWKSLLHPLDDEHYGPFANESQEICNKVWLSGGRVMVNKKTWYAHWHRHREAREGNLYHFSSGEQALFSQSIVEGRAYCKDYWLNDRWPERVHNYQWLADKFGVADDCG